jgi:glycosyltransferase involved in cell wall biosynthesis
MNPMMGILRHAFRKEVNILCAPTHERYQSNFSSLPMNFHMINDDNFVKWKVDHSPIPNNHFLHDEIPPVAFDVVFSQNKFGQYQKFMPIAKGNGLPLVSLEHTLPPPNKNWIDANLENCFKMQGDVNVFISDYSRKAWGFSEENSIVINHCVDQNVFKFGENERIPHVLTVANDYINRNAFLNFAQYQRVTQGLPTYPVGDTPGFSEKARSIEELVDFYQNSLVFLNTANVSPIPMSLLEAMSCGCCVVSCKTCAIPEYISHGETGFLAENDEEMRMYLEYCLGNPSEAAEIGRNASLSIKENYGLETFLHSWSNVFKGLL